MSSTIAPDRILQDMAELWVSLGKQGEGEHGVLRACSMTLLVAAEESDDAMAIGETLAALMPEHPSRAIVIRVAAGRTELAARVFAQCWTPFSQRRQICCEQIEISASDASLPDLAAVVLPLLAPDLPVFLWCRSARLFRLPAFAQFAAIAQKLVIDGSAFDDPGGILKELSAAVAAGHCLADLCWTRLTRWRELIAQIFENREQAAQLSQISEIRIAYGGRATPVPAFYMAAWLRNGLAKLGVKARTRFDAAPAPGGPPLQRVELLAPGGAIASIGLVEGHAAEVRVAGMVNRALLPTASDYALMREELGIPGHDAVFERAVTDAAQLALS
jgi:glucose-6-phosphate dehydrogenase assembly protein OpcA